jgi:hypothetical protein
MTKVLDSFSSKIFVVRAFELGGFLPGRYDVIAMARLSHHCDGVNEGEHGVPLDIVTQRLREDPGQGLSVMTV